MALLLVVPARDVQIAVGGDHLNDVLVPVRFLRPILTHIAATPNPTNPTNPHVWYRGGNRDGTGENRNRRRHLYVSLKKGWRSEGG